MDSEAGRIQLDMVTRKCITKEWDLSRDLKGKLSFIGDGRRLLRYVELCKRRFRVEKMRWVARVQTVCLFIRWINKPGRRAAGKRP